MIVTLPRWGLNPQVSNPREWTLGGDEVLRGEPHKWGE